MGDGGIARNSNSAYESLEGLKVGWQFASVKGVKDREGPGIAPSSSLMWKKEIAFGRTQGYYQIVIADSTLNCRFVCS